MFFATLFWREPDLQIYNRAQWINLKAIFNIFKMARMALTIDFKIPKLNGANYRDWTFNMRLYLESLDLFGHVDGSMGVPERLNRYRKARI